MLYNGSIKETPFTSLVDGSSDNWTITGSGTAEYSYTPVREAIKPLVVNINGSAATEGTVGSLAQGTWGWDSSNKVIVVRTASDSDPDSEAADYVTISEVVTVFTNTVSDNGINLSLIMANNGATTAKIVLWIADSGFNLKFYTLTEITQAESIQKWEDKISLYQGDRIKVMTDIEDLSIIVTGDE